MAKRLKLLIRPGLYLEARKLVKRRPGIVKAPKYIKQIQHHACKYGEGKQEG